MDITPTELLEIGYQLNELEQDMVSIDSGHVDAPMPGKYYQLRRQLWETYTTAYKRLLETQTPVDEELQEQAEYLLEYFSDTTL